MVQRFHHAGIPVSDLPRAVAFYDEVLGFDPLGPADPSETIETATYFWMAITDGEWLNFAVRPDATPDPPYQKDDPHLGYYASESETEAIADRLRDRDIDVREVSTGIYFHDTEGNYVEVTHWDGPTER